MPDYMPTEDGGRWRVPDEFVEARHAQVILARPHGQEVELTFVHRLAPDDEPDGAAAEVVSRVFMPREAFEGWAASLTQALVVWREMGL